MGQAGFKRFSSGPGGAGRRAVGAGRGAGWTGATAAGAAVAVWCMQGSRLALLAKEDQEVLTPEEIEYDNRVRQYKQPYQASARNIDNQKK